MRYWPLTAVLLAFWLGRETGAQDKEPGVARFDRLVVGDIELSGRLNANGAGGRQARLSASGLFLECPTRTPNRVQQVSLTDSELRIGVKVTQPGKAGAGAQVRFEGSAAIGLSGGDGPGYLDLADADGVLSVSALAGQQRDGGQVFLRDRRGKIRVRLTAEAQDGDGRGEPMLELRDGSGKPRARIVPEPE